MNFDMDHALIDALANLNEDYPKDKLAYLLITSLQETQLCGMLAGHLNPRVSDLLGANVTREWNQEGSQTRYDVAVIQHRLPTALIEVKARWSFKLMSERSQVALAKKMREEELFRLSQIPKQCERYLVLFVAHNLSALDSRQEWGLDKYAAGLRKSASLTEEDVKELLQYFGEQELGFPVLANDYVPAGRAFGIDCSLFYLVLKL